MTGQLFLWTASQSVRTLGTRQSDPRRIGGLGNPRPPPPQGSARIVDRRSGNPPPPCCLGVWIKNFKNHQNQPKHMGRRHGRHSKQTQHQNSAKPC